MFVTSEEGQSPALYLYDSLLLHLLEFKMTLLHFDSSFVEHLRPEGR